MTSAEATFHIGETVVYAMQGIGRIDNITTRTVGDRQQGFYQIELEKNKGEVLVPVEEAAALGLRHTLSASEVPQVLQRLQQAASQPVLRGQSENHYLWCKQRLRQEQALGLAEVRRFLHDLEQVEHCTNLRLRQLRSYVYVELPLEIAQALGCSLATAEHLVDTALTSKRPVALPRP